MSLLRKIFGASQGEIWGQLGDDPDAEYIPGGPLTRPKVRKRIGNRTATLESSKSPGPGPGTSKITTTRIRVPFVTKDNFRFTIERKSAMSKGGKPIGRHFLTCGHPEFDADFWVNSRDPEKARALLDDDAYRDLLMAQPSLWLKAKGNAGWFGPRLPEGIGLLMFEEISIIPIRDAGRLRSLFDVLAATLDRLCQIGSATGDDPGVVL